MLNALRRVALGLAVVIAVSATLLLSDLQHRRQGARAPIAAGHKWKIYFVQFNDVIDVEDAANGVMDGLRESGLEEGRDFEVRTLNAQGDMATVSALVDAAVTGGAEMIITFSTPALQAALRRSQGIPVVFNYVSSGLKAGAGKSNRDHVPNVTGVSLMPANDEALTILKTHFPAIHRLGTLYCPAETNMVVAKSALDESARRLGYDVVYVAANTATDVPDAAAALMSRDIDAVLQIPGNLTASAFGSIGEAGRRAKIPIFAFQKSQAVGGAMVVVGRDYRDSGRHAAHLAAEEMIREGAHHLRLDLSEVNYLSSAGVGALMKGYRDTTELQGSFLISAASERVRAVLRLVDLESLLALAARRGMSRGFGALLPVRIQTELRDRVASLNMQLETRMNNPIGSLSGGQRQALTLLMATWHKPELLLLDEHTAALDPKSAGQIVRLTQRIVSEHRLTTLMVTHSMQQAATLGDRIVMMNQGRVIADYAGAQRRRIHADDLVRRFDEIRREEQLDVSAAEMLREAYV